MTAIHEIELTQPLSRIETTAERAMLILRWRGRIVGRIVTAVSNGQLTITDLYSVIQQGRWQEAPDRWLDH